ncbi:MAG: hypothetical protein ING59_15870 [Burkholderiales bacterium]|jgi:hypothetical protein|nr:hypothetical protein [Burkholderiales bacterium]
MNMQNFERDTRDTLQGLQAELRTARVGLGRRVAAGEDADEERQQIAEIRQRIDDAESVLLALPYITIDAQECAYVAQSGPSREDMQARIAAFDKLMAEFKDRVMTLRSGPERIDFGARLLLAARACNSGLRESHAKQVVRDYHLKLEDVQRRADQLRGQVGAG